MIFLKVKRLQLIIGILRLTEAWTGAFVHRLLKSAVRPTNIGFASLLWNSKCLLLDASTLHSWHQLQHWLFLLLKVSKFWTSLKDPFATLSTMSYLWWISAPHRCLNSENKLPHLFTFWYTKSSITSEICCLFYKRSCSVFYPQIVLKVAYVTSATDCIMLSTV